MPHSLQLTRQLVGPSKLTALNVASNGLGKSTATALWYAARAHNNKLHHTFFFKLKK
jgi:hypothetical protein